MKIFSLILLFAILLNAQSGKEIFKQKCESCHVEYIPMSKLKENFMEYNNTKLKLKAPTLNMLSFRLKQQIGSREDDKEFHQFQVEEFIKSYVKEPDPKKSLCIDKVLEIFHTMHSMKGKISDKELEKVAKYIYEYDLKEKKVDDGKKSINFEPLFHRAKKENKIVLIIGESEYCHFCKKMESEVFPLKSIQDILKKEFLPIRVDVYKDKLPLGLKVDITPTLIFIDKNRKVIQIVRGFWKERDLLEILRKVLKEGRN